MLAQRAFAYLGAQLPRQVAKSMSSGASPIRPPERLLFAFDQVFDVLDEPLGALNRAQDGSLSKGQVAALDAIFPTLTNTMRRAVAMAIIDERAHSSEWELPYESEIGVQRLLMADLTPASLKQVLRLPARPSQDGANQPRPQQGGDAPVPMQLMTKTQKTDATTP
jgi:hypothetical protein